MPSKFLTVPAIVAAVSLAATPASAVELPVASHAPIETTSHYGPWVSVGIGGGWGWGGGHRGRHHRHRRGSTAGDILTGILILGTVAAVANAAKRSSERRPYPDRYPYPDRPNPYRYGDARSDGPQGLERAADLCLREVERNARAREVTRIERSASGWLVTGSMADGAAFSCSIGADGRIDNVDVGGRAQEIGSADRQDEGDAYRSAQADVETGADASAQPAYPGGPLPGEDGETDTPET